MSQCHSAVSSSGFGDVGRGAFPLPPSKMDCFDVADLYRTSQNTQTGVSDNRNARTAPENEHGGQPLLLNHQTTPMSHSDSLPPSHHLPVLNHQVRILQNAVFAQEDALMPWQHYEADPGVVSPSSASLSDEPHPPYHESRQSLSSSQTQQLPLANTEHLPSLATLLSQNLDRSMQERRLELDRLEWGKGYERASASTRIANEISIVHEACRLYPRNVEVVHSALRTDPGGIRRRVPIATGPSRIDGAQSEKTNSAKQKRRLSRYELPITIALSLNAPLEVLHLLVRAGPDVLVERDGPEACCSLTVALREKCSFDTIQLLIYANPESTTIQDQHSNLPLHVACEMGSSLATITLIGAGYPHAVKVKNFHGQTPLDIVTRSTMCTDDVIDFLQYLSFHALENEAAHLDHDIDGAL